MKNSNLSKILSLILVISMLFCTSCGTASVDETESSFEETGKSEVVLKNDDTSKSNNEVITSDTVNGSGGDTSTGEDDIDNLTVDVSNTNSNTSVSENASVPLDNAVSGNVLTNANNTSSVVNVNVSDKQSTTPDSSKYNSASVSNGTGVSAHNDAVNLPGEDTDVVVNKEENVNSEGSNSPVIGNEDKPVGNESDKVKVEYPASDKPAGYEPTGEYNEGVILVKAPDGFDKSVLSGIDYVSYAPLYKGASWYLIELSEDADTVYAVKHLTDLDVFEHVEYDYVMKAEVVDVSANPEHGSNDTFFDSHGIYDGWNYLEENGKNPGGSPDVVVAVIDTGVDYNHLDLRNNIWTNPAEIPDNGIDDDGNGYVDDIHGWNCVGDNNDPMDDNGHGTHVAGIIAAENNDICTVGVAYNCKIMVIKAGSSSGYFLNSDIAEAIQYAYMNGASVVNMSFAGYSITGAVEEVIQDAYNQCLLVAAAGNEGRCNQPGCSPHYYQPPMPAYPAALPYVLGVMSTDATGSRLSSFSNFDHYYYNKYEYEGYACGEDVFSTWPNNKYTSLSGTSMASPVMAGIAAVLRSELSDRELYSNKYIQSQLVNTACPANLYDALTNTPLPNTYLYDYYVFDDKDFSEKNNGDGIINAGETIRLAVELMNIGGVASDVEVSIDTIRNGDSDITDPYFTILTESIKHGTIGTYSVRDCEKIYSGTVVTGTEKYFEIVVRDDCPNDYEAVFNVHFTYKNGMDETDTTVYTDNGKQALSLTITNGVVLPSAITEDTVYPGNMRYIVASDVIIADGITVTFEPGAIIQFYQNDMGYYNTIYDSPKIQNYGNLHFTGTHENIITIAPAELFENLVCEINNMGNGVINYTYVNAKNVASSIYDIEKGITIDNSVFSYDTDENNSLLAFNSGTLSMLGGSVVFAESVTNSTINLKNIQFDGVLANVDHSVIMLNQSSGTFYLDVINVSNTLFCVAESTGDSVISRWRLYGNIRNNVFLQESNSNSAGDYVAITLNDADYYASNNIRFNDVYFHCSSNKFYGMYYTHASTLIKGLYDPTGTPLLDLDDTSEQDLSLIPPFITSIVLTNADGEPVSVVGKEKVTYTVTFNRPVVAEEEFCLYFGSRMPYADYKITGEFISDTVWVGEYELKANIENGIQSFKVSAVYAKDDTYLELYDNSKNFGFIIDTTAAMSMNLLAVEKDNGIELTFAQDDYDTLLGYNIYRSEEKDGNFVKLNPAILLPTDEKFLDENAEPGKTYWYTYTVVLTDFTESNPAGKVMATAKDTMVPSLYHTPVNQGYENNNLVISCIASDNVGIKSVTLYYRAVGDTQWKTLAMGKHNDNYSVAIFGRDVSLAGIEYYIVASDGVSEVTRGSADVPYTVVVKSAESLSRMGDVDGNGQVSTKDALMLMQCLNGDLLLADDQFKRADLNRDGILSSVEALRILQYINGKVTTLEM